MTCASYKSRFEYPAPHSARCRRPPRGATEHWRNLQPLWRYLDNAVTKSSRRCGDLHRCRAQAKRGSAAAAKLQAQVETAERRLEGLQIARRQLPRQVRVLVWPRYVDSSGSIRWTSAPCWYQDVSR